MKLVTSYQPAYFQIHQLSESNLTEVFITHPTKQLLHHYDVTLQYLVFKIAHFVSLNRRHQPVKFHWPRLSGSNLMMAGGKHPPPQTYTLSKGLTLFDMGG